MRKFPKNLKTRDDIYNCLDMVRAGQLKASDLVNAINKIKNQNYINAVITEVSEDRKTVTTNYLAEADVDGRAKVENLTVTIKRVTHIEGEPDKEGKTSFVSSEIEVSRAVAAGAEVFALEKIGSDYYIYICDPTNGDEKIDEDEVYKISLSSTYPSGFTASNSRKIGGFHYGVVRNVNENGNPVNSSGAEFGSGWQSNVYNGIVPNSVWTLLHRPKCDPTGMVYIGNGLWGDIYLSSDDGFDGLASVYNEPPITGTEGLNWYIANEKARRVGKRLPSYAEFCQAAYGAPEGQDGNNTYAWSATGNTARANCGAVTYAVSAVNIRDLVGNVWKWVDEFCLDPTASAWGWQDVLGSGHGDAYIPSATALHAFICGGAWADGIRGGDRALDCNGCPWSVGAHVGVWCVCDSQ